MVSIDRIKTGIRKYIDQQILPNMSGVSRFGAALYIELVLQTSDDKIMQIINTPYIKATGIVQDGLVDIDRIYLAACQQLDAGRRVDVQIPVVGHVLFSRRDLDRMYGLIKAEE